MHILYAINDAFAPQVSASIASVCTNNSNAEYLDFYILADHLSQETRTNLYECTASFGRSIFVIDIDGYLDNFKDFDTKGWREIVLARLLLSRFLPADLERILYLDGDTICIGNLENLWSTDLSGFVLGAVIEPTVDRKRVSNLGISHRPYFNSGVLLFNLKEWRVRDAESLVLSSCKSRKDEFLLLIKMRLMFPLVR